MNISIKTIKTGYLVTDHSRKTEYLCEDWQHVAYKLRLFRSRDRG